MSHVNPGNGKPVPFATRRKEQVIKGDANEKQVKVYTFLPNAAASPGF